MSTPKVYLIKRGLKNEEMAAVLSALSIHPLDAVIYADVRDGAEAQEYAEKTFELHRPIAILADFDAPLTAINDDGSLCPVL